MEIFYDVEQHYSHLIAEAAKKPKSVIITSYGIYAGITQDGRDSTEWGEKYHLYSRDFLESLTDVPEVRIIIGLPDYRSCKGRSKCEDCETNYIASLIKIYNHADKFAQYKWRMSTASHIKCALFINDAADAASSTTYRLKVSGVIGGRNLNDSMWTDTSYTIEGQIAGDLCVKVINFYKQCHPITLDSLDEVIKTKGISPTTLEKMINA